MTIAALLLGCTGQPYQPVDGGGGDAFDPCGPECSDGWVCCETGHAGQPYACTELLWSNGSCGACGVRCENGTTCDQGVCVTVP